MKVRPILFITAILFLSGCADESDAQIDEFELSPSFAVSETDEREMVGVEGSVGLLFGDFAAGEPSKQMWHFWGDDLQNKLLTVKAFHQETDTEINPFVREEEHRLSGPNNGADYHLPSLLKLTEPGIWKMDIYLNEEYYDSIVVDVIE